MEETKVRVTCDEGVAVLTMNCPTNLNAIDVTMAQELLTALKLCEEDSAVKTILLLGGDHAFSAGGDIRYLYRNLQSGVQTSSELVVLVGELALYMKRMRKLVVTAVRGPAAGAGANLALAGDFVLASETASFIQAFVGIALVPDTGGPYLLSRSIGAQRALEMCITGRPVPAQEAYRLGLVYRLYPEENVEKQALALARQLSEGPLLAYSGIKRQVYGAAFQDYEHYLSQVEESTMNACAGTHDYEEGVRAFVEKRRPQFRGN